MADDLTRRARNASYHARMAMLCQETDLTPEQRSERSKEIWESCYGMAPPFCKKCGEDNPCYCSVGGGPY